MRPPLPLPAAAPGPPPAPPAGLAHSPPVGTLGDEPRHQQADDAPEHAHHDQRHREAAVRHAGRRPASPGPSAALGSHPEVSTPGRVTSARRARLPRPHVTRAPTPPLGGSGETGSAPTWRGCGPLLPKGRHSPQGRVSKVFS